MGIKLVVGPQPVVEKDREIELRLEKTNDGTGFKVSAYENGRPVPGASICGFYVRSGKIHMDRYSGVCEDVFATDGCRIKVT